jgi:hypothetical protein
LFASFASGIVGTGGKFTTGINNTSGTSGKILPPVSLIPMATLPRVSLIPVVHLDLRTSPHIFEKFERTLMLFSGAWGRLIHEENLKQKNS